MIDISSGGLTALSVVKCVGDVRVTGTGVLGTSHVLTKKLCWSFMLLQHLRSYQDGCRIVTVHTHGDVTLLLNWEIMLTAK